MTQAVEYSGTKWSGRGTLKQMVDELDRQKDAAFDFVTDTRNLGVEVQDGQAILIRTPDSECNVREWVPSEGLPINFSAIAQLGEKVSPSVPTRFIRKLIEERPAVASEFMTQMLNVTATPNLIRCLDGSVRAFLSDRYQPMDNYTLAFSALEIAREHGGEVVECSLTDNHMRIKMTSRAIYDSIEEGREMPVSKWYTGGLGNAEHLRRVGATTGGDLPGGPGTVHPLITIGNSETGQGSMFVRMGILRAICFNLASVETTVNQVHLGQRLDVGIFSQDTIRKDTVAIMAKAGDSITSAFSADRFKAIVARCQAANEHLINPTTGVDFTLAQKIITEEQRDSLLAHFVGGDVPRGTAYGLAQAVARLAQDTDDADQAHDLESFAGRIIATPEMVH